MTFFPILICGTIIAGTIGKLKPLRIMKKKKRNNPLDGFLFGDLFGNMFPSMNDIEKERQKLDSIFENLFEEENGNKQNKTEESGEDENGKWNVQTWTDEDGTTCRRTVITSGNFGMFRHPDDPARKPDLKLLEERMKKAIEEERFEDAAKYRDEIAKAKKPAKVKN